MKKLIVPIITLVGIIKLYAQTTVTPSSSENYIQTTSYLDYPLTTDQNQTTKTLQTVQYFDGLGRIKQIVEAKTTPLGKDLVTDIPYDELGRQTDVWLPVPMATLNGGIHSGVNSEGISYYGDNRPFAHKNLEISALDRPLSVTQPGTAWYQHPLRYEYKTNAQRDVYKFITTTSWSNGSTNSVLKVAPDSDNSPAGFYKAGTLYKNLIIDEDNNITIEFKNGKGQILLIRKILTSPDGLNVYNMDTYYVYNEYNQLAFVISPKAVQLLILDGLEDASIVDGPILKNLCYQYRYDSRNRLVEKKLPEKGWEYMVYDKQDRLVLTQDAVMGASRKWIFTKYDQFGRIAFTGTYTSSYDYSAAGRASEQVNVDAKGSNNTTPSGATAVGFNSTGMDVYYYNNSSSYPNTFTNLLSINYYDNYPLYSFNPAFPPNSIADNFTANKVNTRGLPTMTLVKNMEDDNWTKNYNYYDEKGRIIGTHSINYLGGYTRTETGLNFSGLPKQTVTKHKRLATDTEKIITETFAYDHQNRLLVHKHKVGDFSEEILTQNNYNEILQVVSKKVGGTDTGNPLQTIDYQYNIRGWMTGINNPANLNGDLFGYKLNYNQTEGLETPNTDYSDLKVKPKFNGNIAEIAWNSAVSPNNNIKRYGYVYDSTNRLLAGFYQKDANPSAKEYFEKATYDLNGNIESLKRSEAVVSTGQPAMIIDDLAYQIGTGNQVTGIVDFSSQYNGYPDISGNLIDYDVNGNMTNHKDKGILNILYNPLNQIHLITFDQTYVPRIFSRPVNVRTEYLYTSLGEKLRKKFYHKNPDFQGTGEELITTDYLNGFQYESKKINDNAPTLGLKFIPTAEGYYNFENNKYIYNYVDHLGNVRLSYRKGDSGIEIIDENNYYPFGLTHQESSPAAASAPYQYKYNGKERQAESGMYDYGARFYMPDIGRWGVVDPLAEQYRRHSTYNYAMNNPIRFIDPDGRGTTSTGVTENKDGTYTVVSAKDDGNNGIYRADEKGNYDVETSDHIANSLTPRSFIGDDNQAVVGAVISPGDLSGNDFLNDLMGPNEPNIIKYMANGKGNEQYDFKTNGPNGEAGGTDQRPEGMTVTQYTYRGVLFSIDTGNKKDNVSIIASARDIGNFGAGYIAGNNGLTWGTGRLGFDALQSWQQRGLATEGQTTQMAQKVGHTLGLKNYSDRRAEAYKIQSSNPLRGPK